MSSTTMIRNPSNSHPQSRRNVADDNIVENGRSTTASQYTHGPPMTRVPGVRDDEGPRIQDEPPRHSRPLYWTIPLPSEDGPNTNHSTFINVAHHPQTVNHHGVAPFIPPSPQARSAFLTPAPFLIGQYSNHGRRRHSDFQFHPSNAIAAELHVALAMHVVPHGHNPTYFPRMEGSRRLGRIDLPEPATYPPVHHLTVVSAVDGSSMEVHGRQIGGGADIIVVVSDVLDAIETLNEEIHNRMESLYGNRSVLMAPASSRMQEGLSVYRHSGNVIGVLAIRGYPAVP